jgi:hypothetical protein
LKHHPKLISVYDIKVPCSGRVERLIHAELRRKRHQNTTCHYCQKNHKEWFEVDKDIAIATLKAWKDISSRKALYSESGRLSRYWAEQLSEDPDDYDSTYLISLLDASDRLAAEGERLPHQETLAAEAERLNEAKRLDEVARLVAQMERLAAVVERLTVVVDRVTEDNRLLTEERRAEERRVADQLQQDLEVETKRLAEQARQSEGYRAAEQARTTGAAQLEDQGVTVSDDSSAAETAPISAQLPRDALPAVPNIPHIVTPPATPQRHVSISPTGADCTTAREDYHEKCASQSDDPFSLAFHGHHGSVDAKGASPSAEQRFLSSLTPPATPLRHNIAASASAIEASPSVGQKTSRLLTPPETPLSHRIVSSNSADRTFRRGTHHEESSDQSEAPVPSLVQEEASSAVAVNAASNQSLNDDPDAILQAFSDPHGILAGAEAEAETAAVMTTATTTGGVPALAAFALGAMPPTTTDGDAPSSTPFTSAAAAPATVAFQGESVSCLCIGNLEVENTQINQMKPQWYTNLNYRDDMMGPFSPGGNSENCDALGWTSRYLLF